VQRSPKSVLCECNDLGRIHGNSDINEKRYRRQPRNETDQQQRTTNNLDHPDEWSHDVGPRDADLRETPDSEGIGEQKLLYASERKTQPTRMRISKIALAARFAQVASAFTGIDLTPRNTRAFGDEASPAHT
jgi:hypothetical protein